MRRHVTRRTETLGLELVVIVALVVAVAALWASGLAPTIFQTIDEIKEAFTL